MSKKRECLDCGDYSYTLLKDLRTPPLGEGNCLCRDCLYQAVELLIEEKQEEITYLRASLNNELREIGVIK